MPTDLATKNQFHQSVKSEASLFQWQIMKLESRESMRMEERVVLGFIAVCELTVVTIAGTILFFLGRYLWRLI
jgi:hypothetical protein